MVALIGDHSFVAECIEIVHKMWYNSADIEIVDIEKRRLIILKKVAFISLRMQS